MKSTRLLLLVSCLFAALIPPALASHEPVQSLSIAHPADDAQVGMDAEGTATAVWSDNSSRGTLLYATRPVGGRFGEVGAISGASRPGEVSFFESPNGNAVVAWTDDTPRELQAAVRIGPDAPFGPGQVVLADAPVGGPSFIDASISDSGRAVVAWQEQGPNGSEARAALFDGGTWATPALLGTGGVPATGMNAKGAALVVFEDPSQDQLLSASAPVGAGFAAEQVIEILEQAPSNPDVAVNSAGAAVIVYADFVSPNACTRGQTCSRDWLEARSGNVNGAFGAAQAITNPNNPMATGIHEVAIDDSGQAAVLFTATFNASSGLFASVSDATGTFITGTWQTISSQGSGLGLRRMLDIAAGGGNFTAHFANDHDADQTVEVWRSTTSGGSFGASHQVSPELADDAQSADGARSASGDVVGAWTVFTDDRGMTAQAAPVAQGTDAVYGTDGSDSDDGTASDDTYYAGGGDDTYNAGAGNDSVWGEAGDDGLAGGPGADFLAGGTDNDYLAGGDAGDTLKGEAGNDTLSGDAATIPANTASGMDRYLLAGAPDFLFGGGGRDKLIGGAGLDTLNGGPGKDVCHVDSRKEKLRAKSCEVIRFRRPHG